MPKRTDKLKIVILVILGLIGIAILSYYVPDIWTSKRNYAAGQRPTAAEKMDRFRTCLIEAGLTEGTPDGDFVLDPIYKTVDGEQIVDAFFYRFPDRILNDEGKVLKIEACKNFAAR